jgi:hypothetical protein
VSGPGRYKSEESRQRALANLKRGPAAPPRNSFATRHGAYARVTAEERQGELQRIYDALAADAPMLAPADGVKLELLADALVQLRRCRRDMEDHGWRDAKTGEERPVVERAQRLRREVAEHLRDMGMDLRSRAALLPDLARGLDAATALSAAREEPDPALRRALLAAAGLVDGAEGGRG